MEYGGMAVARKLQIAEQEGECSENTKKNEEFICNNEKKVLTLHKFWHMKRLKKHLLTRKNAFILAALALLGFSSNSCRVKYGVLEPEIEFPADTTVVCKYGVMPVVQMPLQAEDELPQGEEKTR